MSSNVKPVKERLLTNEFGEQYYYSINRNLFATKRSVDVFTNSFYKKFDGESTFYIISGTDSGLLINYILNQKTPKGTQFLFIENANHIDDIKNKTPELADANHIKMCTPDDWQSVANDMHIDTYIYQYKVFFYQSIAATDLHDFDYHEINLKIEMELHEYIFVLHTSIGNQSFLDQQLMNIAENITPVNVLKGIFSKKRCIILAGGPSLDEVLDWVILHRDKLIVIAVSRISNRLLNANLTPDIVVSVDPIHNSFEVSRELLISSPDIVFVNTNNVNAGLLSQWQGKNVYFGDLLPWDSPLNVENINGSGPTVTNSAISLAIFMGIETILLAGVDLCNSASGYSHASGSIEAEVTGANLAFIGVNTTTYAGHNAQTTVQMSLAARVLNTQAAQAKSLGVTLYNLSVNAAAIDDIEYIKKEDLKLHHYSNIHNSLSEAIPNTTISQQTAHNTAILTELDQLIVACDTIYELAIDALDHNEKLFDDTLSDEQAYEHKLAMDDIESRLDTTFKVSAGFIKEYGIKYFVECVQPQDDEEWDDEQLKLTGKLYYQAYQKSSKLVQEKLKETRQRLQTRINELSNHPNIEQITAQWNIDSQPGRVQIFEKTHHALSFSKSEQKLLAQQKHKFHELIHQATSFKKALTQVSPLEGIKKKILLLFRQQDKENLTLLVDGLFKYAEKNDDAAPLYYLSQAYLLSLNGDYESSLHAFEDMGSENIGEDELVQITSNALKLQLPELAESALSMLVSFNDMYLPQYANILKLSGKTTEAIDAYINYLNTYDMDLYNWLEVGKLFINIGAKDSAVIAFNRALTLDPKNITANDALNSLQNTN